MAATSGPQLVIVGGGFAGLFAARALDEMGTILWTAGIEAPPLAAAVARAPRAEQDRAGRLVCGKDLSLPGHPQILVTWDLMSLDKLPGVAEVAIQTGHYAGRKIRQESQGQAYKKPFRYRDRGSAAYISPGRHAATPVKQKESRS